MPKRRPAHPRDAASLAALSIEVWLSTYLKRGVSAPFADYVLSEFTAVALTAAISDPSQTIHVADGPDGVEGYLRLKHPDSVADGREAEVATLYIRPCCHRRGIGRALLAEAITQARAARYSALWLTANVDNRAALAFYAAEGFEITGTKDFELDGVGYPNHILRRIL